MKYLVMERHVGYVILLDEEGRMLRAADRNYEVGQTVVAPLLLGGKAHITRRRPVILCASLLAGFLLILLGFQIWQTQFAVWTTVHLSINPDVAITLNKQGVVLDVVGQNEDGKALLVGYAHKGKDRRIVTEEIVALAIQKGYLQSGGTVTVDIDAKDRIQGSEYAAEMESRILLATAGMQVTVHVVGEQGASPGTSDSESLTAPLSTQFPGIIDAEHALALALSHAGISHSDYQTDECELEQSDGRTWYEIEFHTEDLEYEYSIDAVSGQILSHKSEPRDD